MSNPGTRHVLARELRSHRQVEPGLCACGWYSTGDGRTHVNHLTDTLAAALEESA